MKLKFDSRNLIVFFILFGLTSFVTTVNGQSYAIGHTTITFTDPARGNRSIPTEIYYPADTAGDNVPVTATTVDAFPLLTFGHGFVMTWNAYQNIWTTVVPNGYIIAFPKTEGGISPSHLEFAKDMAFVTSQITALGLSETSIFYNRVAPQNALMGHSMGGGAAFLAVSLTPSATALVTLAPAETNPSAIQAASGIAIPSLIFAGGNDCVTPTATNQTAMYNQLVSDCKTYVEIIGGSHCQMADYNLLCSIGESSCSPAPAITRDEQHAVINNYLVNWLNSKLKSDCTSGAAFDALINNDPAISFQKNCVLCDPLATNRNTVKSLTIYPNPFSNYLQITSAQNIDKTCSIYDLSMRKIHTQKFNGNLLLNAESWENGIYIYQIVDSNNFITSGKIIKKGN